MTRENHRQTVHHPHLNVKNVHRNFPTSISAGKCIRLALRLIIPPRNTMQKGENYENYVFVAMQICVSHLLSCLFSTLICSLQLSVKLTERKVATNHGMFNQHCPEKHCCNDYSNESAAGWTDLSSSGSLNHGD